MKKDSASTIREVKKSGSSAGAVNPPPSPGPSANAVAQAISTRNSAASFVDKNRFMGIPPFCRSENNPPIVTEAIKLFSTGEHKAAQKLLNELLHVTHGDEKLSVTNWLAKIARAAGCNEQAITIHLLAERLVAHSSNYFLIGNYELGLGNSRLLQGDKASAERHYESAARYFVGVPDYPHYAMAVNNQNFLLIEQGRADEAIPNLEEARRMLFSAGMDTQVAIVDDTIAQAYFALNNLSEALFYSYQSVSVLFDAGEPKTLQASVETMRKILAAVEGGK